MTSASPILIHVPVTEIFATAGFAPNAEALRHKRRGQWRCWSRADITAESESLARALVKRGINARSTVAISGDYAPASVIFAIASARAGARTVSVPTRIARQDLTAWLRDEPVVIAFVGLREQLGKWRAALQESARQSEIVADFHLPWGHAAAAGITAAVDLLGDAAGGRDAGRSANEVLWIEEGTDWSDGLGFLLQALVQGATLAFPESRTAAGRDRRETQPVHFALSAAHHLELARDLATRLPTGHSLAASLTRNALSAGSRGSTRSDQRWLLRRIRRPFGLANLRELTVVGLPNAAPEASDPVDLFGALGIRAGHVEPPGRASGHSAQPPLAFA
jgi:hypothetical protein